MINFPTSLDSLPNPTSTDLEENAVTALDHDQQHSNANDAIEALEAKVGIDGSAVTTSHSYKLGEVTGSDKAVGKTATQTLTNKTLTSPQINFGSDATGDLFYRNGGGVTARLPIGTSSQILQVSSTGIPEWIANPGASDASTTVKGVSEEGTQAEVDAGTAVGGTSARLFINPSTLRAKKYHDKGTPSGGTDAYTFTVSPTITAYSDGQVFTFEADVANTGAATLNVSSVGAKTIKKNKSSDLETGDIVAGQYIMVQYDSGDDTFQMLSPVSGTSVTGTNGVLTQANDTTTDTITHGLGRTPKIIRVSFFGQTVNSISSNINSGTGVWSGNSNKCIYYIGATTGNGGGPFTDSTNSIRLYAANVSNNYLTGQISNVGATTFDITWASTGTGADGVLIWDAQ